MFILFKKQKKGLLGVCSWQKQMCDWIRPTSKQLKRSRVCGHVYVVVGRPMLQRLDADWEEGLFSAETDRMGGTRGHTPNPRSKTSLCDTNQHFNTQLTTAVTDS